MKILIVKLSSLGDIVHAIPALNALKKLIPEAQIDWLVYEKFAGILEGQQAIENLHRLEDKKIISLYEKAKQLQAENYDLVIDLQGLMKTALMSFYICPRVLGLRQPREIIAKLFYRYRADIGDLMDPSSHIIIKNLLLVNVLAQIQSLPVPVIEVDYGALGEGTYAVHNDAQKKLCIIPSTTWQTKLWLKEYWLEFIESLGEKIDYELYILGTANDMSVIEPLIADLKKPFHLVANKSLDELPDFFRSMNYIVGVDTGPMHIAAAACYPEEKSSVKIVGLYGPTSARRTGPYGFSYLSYDEIMSEPASHKRKNDESMKALRAELVIEQLTI